MNRYRDWLEQGERDLRRAELDIQFEFWEWACFTTQQAAEKVVKALLMRHGYSVWGHAMTPMLRQLANLAVPESIIEFAQLLDAYYIQTRYPNGFASGKPADYYNRPKAEEAIRAATEIIRFCKDHLD
ncbi:MAG: HEPN domain-containing protein [Anaerolineaceae bacterium]|nr:HEPN domain-containing protein [Anaerolineaceae bacterium]